MRKQEKEYFYEINREDMVFSTEELKFPHVVGCGARIFACIINASEENALNLCYHP